jgi:hypothetical protein
MKASLARRGGEIELIESLVAEAAGAQSGAPEAYPL